MKKTLACVAAAVLLVTAGCRVQVDKDDKGSDKNVKIDTPLGGLHVRSNDMTAADVGLPVYPGASVLATDKDKSADIHMGFGEWQIRVKVIKYQTGDGPDKVLDFYQKALGRFGTVIRCQGNNPVGTPTVTAEGLNCADENNSHIQIQTNMGQSDINQSLKAGSRHHQHIVGIETSSKPGQTNFTLVELELPSGIEKNSSSQ